MPDFYYSPARFSRSPCWGLEVKQEIPMRINRSDLWARRMLGRHLHACQGAIHLALASENSRFAGVIAYAFRVEFAPARAPSQWLHYCGSTEIIRRGHARARTPRASRTEIRLVSVDA